MLGPHVPCQRFSHGITAPPHDSGPMWLATPSSYDSLIHYTLPVSRRFRVRRDNCDSAGNKSQEPLIFRAYFRRDFPCGHPSRIEYPDAFCEGRSVIDADHERPFIGGSLGGQVYHRSIPSQRQWLAVVLAVLDLPMHLTEEYNPRP